MARSLSPSNASFDSGATSEARSPDIRGRARRLPRPLGAALWLLAAASTAGCPNSPRPREPGARRSDAPPVAVPIYDGGYAGGWSPIEWFDAEAAPRRAAAASADGGAAATSERRKELSRSTGWTLIDRSFQGRDYGLVFRFRAPEALGDFLEVRLDSAGAPVFPRVAVGPAHRKDLSDGWSEVSLSPAELNPTSLPFDRVIVRARRSLPAEARIELDGLALTQQAGAGATAPSSGTRRAQLEIDCSARGTPISPLIYGVAFKPMDEFRSDAHWAVGATARRWGGNPTSRYNWELGNAWNTAADYFFRNVDYTGRPGFSWRSFFDANEARGVASALTVPTLGWVAKDTTSYAFPVQHFGAQQRVDPTLPEAGNGVDRSGRPLAPRPPTTTSVPAPPESIERWVRAIRERDERVGARSVALYFLDNEPMLWHDTHRDVQPEPLGYDELLRRTIAYATAIRRADPKALIAGPAEWGWPAYFYSAKDAVAGFDERPDRRAHGDVPLLTWYLKQLAEHERRTGVRLLDVLDLHYYPQAPKIGVGTDGATDRDTAALRIRSTRALWDFTYRDESWIAEPVQLIPRMRRWAAESYPGLKLSIGEYNFGAEQHPSGGLAVAEALGRFGREGLYSAFYWSVPPPGSPAAWAFRAYRNYDGEGGRFLDLSLPASAPRDTSAFASRDAPGRRVTVVALNLSPTDTLEATAALRGCPPAQSRRVFTYRGDAAGFVRDERATERAFTMPPWSMSVVDVGLADAIPPPEGKPGAARP